MRGAFAFTLMLSGLASGSGYAQQASSVLGRKLDLGLRGSQSVSGELLAVERDSLWLLLPPDRVRVVPLGDVVSVQARHRGLTAGGVLGWTVVGGLISGALLTAACSSVDDADCGQVFPAVFLSWGLVGGLSAAVMSGGRPRSIHIAAGSLAPYARFPQGLPDRWTPDMARGPDPGRGDRSGRP
ncbi:MAG: hypothetical protein HY337_11065 [Gemmatimonadetes bacterium]|nr:hypothetical protein [Gemmatimonadota bacterium]